MENNSVIGVYSDDGNTEFIKTAGKSSQESKEDRVDLRAFFRHETPTMDSLMTNKDLCRIYNGHFFYGLCHVCRKLSDSLDSTLKKCSKCQLVCYCSVECQKKDWKLHKPLCKINALSPAGKNVFGVAKKVIENDGNDIDWITYRLRSLDYNIIGLKRNLKRYEKQMLLYPRVCFVCKESDPVLLVDCTSCYSTAYCSEEHKEEDKDNHKELCCMLNMAKKYYVFVRENDILGGPLPPQILEEFQSLQSKTLTNKIYYNDADMVQIDDLFLCLMSDVITYPLSIIFALEKVAVLLGKQEQTISNVQELTVHVVGAWHHKEILGIKKWEYFMHMLPALTKLRVLFVGPQIWNNVPENYRYEGKLRGCDDCQDKGRQVCYEESQMHYHDYVQTDYYRKPDVIVSFNCGFHCLSGIANDTWPESLVKMTNDHTVPLIFTSYNKYEAEHDLLAVKNATDVDILLEVNKNPFSSLNPIRNLVTPQARYENPENMPLPLAGHENCENIINFNNCYISVVKGKNK